jgi:hypothetical protein
MRPDEQTTESGADHDDLYKIVERLPIEGARHVRVIDEGGEVASDFDVLIDSVGANPSVTLVGITSSDRVKIDVAKNLVGLHEAPFRAMPPIAEL